MSHNVDLAGEPDDISRAVDGAVRQAERRYEQFGAAQSRMDSATTTECSPDGVVRVTVRASGAVADLTLSDRVRTMSARHIAAAVLGCVQRAQAKVADTVHAILRDTVAGDDPLVADIVSSLRQRFPPPSGAPLPAPETKPRERSRAAADDDWNERSILS